MIDEQIRVARQDRTSRVIANSLVFLQYKSRIQVIYRTKIKVQLHSTESYDTSILKLAVEKVNLINFDTDSSVKKSQMICDALFLELSEHFADGDIIITTQTSDNTGVTVHYRDSKPNLSIKI